MPPRFALLRTIPETRLSTTRSITKSRLYSTRMASTNTNTTAAGTGTPSSTAQAQKPAETNMSPSPSSANPTSTSTSGLGSGSTLNSSELGIENTNIKTAPGIELNANQKVLVGSVLDLFGGKVTLRKLGLWDDKATFQDPLTNAEGRKQYAAQWYGLAAAFSKIEQLHAEVTNSGNPIELDLKTKYTVKGIGKEQTIQSLVRVYTSEDHQKITAVEDRWNGNIPDGAIAKVFRNLNSVVVPAFVSVPKSEEGKKGE